MRENFRSLKAYVEDGSLHSREIHPDLAFSTENPEGYSACHALKELIIIEVRDLASADSKAEIFELVSNALKIANVRNYFLNNIAHPTAVYSEESAYDYSVLTLGLLKRAHAHGIALEEIRLAILDNKLAVYVGCPYYCSRESMDWYSSGVEFSDFGKEEKQRKFTAFYDFLVYLESYGLGLRDIQEITSQCAMINYYYGESDKLEESFVSFLSHASGDTILKYIESDFIVPELLEKLNPAVGEIAAAITSCEAERSFALILIANDTRTPLGHYFGLSKNQAHRNSLNAGLFTTHATQTLKFIRAKALNSAQLRILAQHRMLLVDHFTVSPNIAILREALDPGSALGQFFKLSLGFFDSTAAACQSKLQVLLEKNTRAIPVAIGNSCRLFGTSERVPGVGEGLAGTFSVSLNHA